MIATTKMRRAQEQALAGRPYAEKIHQVIADLAAPYQGEDAIHPLLQRRTVGRIEVIHITADRGLCGGFNSNMNRATANFILRQTTPVSLITVGRKGRDFMLRYGYEIRAEFSGIGDRPSLVDTRPISRIVIDDYTEGFADQVFLAYTQFITTMIQRPRLELLVPVEPVAGEREYPVEYIYEPSLHVVLAELLPRYVEMQVYHAILESIASEQLARMVAMRNASDNAEELIQEFTLMYNKARQEMITKELLDISGGVEALA